MHQGCFWVAFNFTRIGREERHEEGTVVAMELYRRALQEYQSVIQIDMHTGYGPRDQMSIIMSPLDHMSSKEASGKFSYPLVLKITAEEFYDISGDMAAYYYELRNKHFPDKQLFACGFEFGTFGSSLLARIRSLRAMVFENQMHWYGAKSERLAHRIHREFEELYFPAEKKMATKGPGRWQAGFRWSAACLSFNMNTLATWNQRFRRNR